MTRTATSYRSTPESLERRNFVGEYWTQGFSSGKIAEMLGCSRSIVMGCIYRINLHRCKLGLAPLLHPGGAKRIPSRPRTPPKPVEPPAPPPPNPPISLDLTLEDCRPGLCYWPMNDGRPEYLFCANPAATNHVYCGYHKRIGGVPAKVGAK